MGQSEREAVAAKMRGHGGGGGEQVEIESDLKKVRMKSNFSEVSFLALIFLKNRTSWT